jgi:hypothetical protein
MPYSSNGLTRDLPSPVPYAVAVTGTPPRSTTTSSTISITGNLNGSALSLSLNGEPTTFGTMSSGTFTLDVPQPDGTLAPIQFHSAPATDFNSSVAALQQQVASSNQQEAAAEAKQKQQQAAADALAKAQRRVDGDSTAIAKDLSAVTQGESVLSVAVTSAQGALQDVSDALAKVHTEEQQVITEAQKYPGGNNGQVCYDATQQVGYDASQSVRKIGRPAIRKAAPKKRPRMVCLNWRAHVISTRDPCGAAMAVMVQLLPGA